MKRILAQAGFSTGIFGLASRLAVNDRFLILMYHRMGAFADHFITPLTINNFEKQIRYLRRHYRITTLEDIFQLRQKNEKIGSRRLAITFDDCFTELYREAFPLLKSLGVAATGFISTGFVDTDRIPWSDELEFLFKKTSRQRLDLKWRGGEKNFSWSHLPGKLNALADAKTALKKMEEKERSRVFEDVREQLGVNAKDPSRILTSKQVREMAEAGIRFGAHTVNHVILTQVPEGTARWEVEESKKQLEAITGRECLGFCYPNGEPGDFSPDVKEMVHRAGYEYSCTVLEGTNGAETDRYELKRLWTSEQSLPLFAARLLRHAIGGYKYRSRRKEGIISAPAPSSTRRIAD